MKKNNLFSFEKLSKKHLPLLLHWLNSPHVQQFWDSGVVWTEKLVLGKYASYIEGYKLIDNNKLPIWAFIIYFDKQPIGYIQAYDAIDFPRDGYSLTEVLKDTLFIEYRLAAIDIFIADIDYVGKGIGSSAMKEFLDEFIWKNYDGCFVDPLKINTRAIRAYEKAGFVKIKETNDRKNAIMIVTKNHA